MRRPTPDLRAALDVTASTDALPTTSEAAHPASGPSRLLQVLLLTVTVTASLALLARWDSWFISPDGGLYLALAERLPRAGYTYPDGSFAAFRGPSYPAVLSFGWLVLEDTVRSAIWVSRAVMALNAGLVALLVARVSGRVAPGLVAGLVAASQPLMLVSGSQFLVPDGLAALFVLSGALVLVTGPPTRSAHAGAGFLLGIGAVTKESVLLFVVLLAIAVVVMRRPAGDVAALLFGAGVPVTAWVLFAQLAGGVVPEPYALLGGAFMPILLVGMLASLGFIRLQVRSNQPRSWLFLVAGVVMFLLLRLSAGSGLRPASQLFNELILDVDRQLYRDSLWWLSLPFLAAALAWILGRRRRPEVPMVLALLTGGTVLLVHTVLAAGGLRNGLMVGYALSLVAGLIVAERHQRLVRLVGFLTVVAFAISSVTASEATNERLDAEALSADTAAVRRTAAYLAGLPQEATVATTRAFAGMLAFESSRDLLLLPFGSGPTQLVDPTPEPERQRGWAGPVSGSWIGPVVAVMEARTETGFFGAGDINEFRVDQGVTHVVVSGNLADAASVTDGGFLLDLLVQSPNAEAVFRSSTEEFPQWLVVFEVTGRPLIAEQPPIVLDVLDDGAASYDEDQVSVDLLTYRNAVIESFVAIQP